MAEKRTAIIRCDNGQIEGEVENIIISGSDQNDAASEIVAARYPVGYIAVDCTGWNTVIGDRYKDGKFYRLGEQVPRILAAKEEISTLRTSSSQMNMAIMALMDKIVEMKNQEGTEGV